MTILPVNKDSSSVPASSTKQPVFSKTSVKVATAAGTTFGLVGLNVLAAFTPALPVIAAVEAISFAAVAAYKIASYIRSAKPIANPAVKPKTYNELKNIDAKATTSEIRQDLLILIKLLESLFDLKAGDLFNFNPNQLTFEKSQKRSTPLEKTMGEVKTILNTIAQKHPLLKNEDNSDLELGLLTSLTLAKAGLQEIQQGYEQPEQKNVIEDVLQSIANLLDVFRGFLAPKSPASDSNSSRSSSPASGDESFEPIIIQKRQESVVRERIPTPPSSDESFEPIIVVKREERVVREQIPTPPAIQAAPAEADGELLTIDPNAPIPPPPPPIFFEKTSPEKAKQKREQEIAKLQQELVQSKSNLENAKEEKKAVVKELSAQRNALKEFSDDMPNISHYLSTIQLVKEQEKKLAEYEKALGMLTDLESRVNTSLAEKTDFTYGDTTYATAEKKELFLKYIKEQFLPEAQSAVTSTKNTIGKLEAIVKSFDTDRGFKATFTKYDVINTAIESLKKQNHTLEKTIENLTKNIDKMERQLRRLENPGKAQPETRATGGKPNLVAALTASSKMDPGLQALKEELGRSGLGTMTISSKASSSAPSNDLAISMTQRRAAMNAKETDWE